MLSNVACSHSYSRREQVLVAIEDQLSCLKFDRLFWALLVARMRRTVQISQRHNKSKSWIYCGGPNTLLTRERTINQYRPKSASDLRTRVIGLNYHTRLAGCETCACICAKGKPELWSIVTAEKIGSRSNYILIEFWIISWVDKATTILL